MTLSFNQRIIVWLILAICFTSIPVSMFVHSNDAAKADLETSQFKSFLEFRDRIAVVKLNGMIIDKESNSLLPAIGSYSSALKSLHKDLKDTHVKAVLLRINSPGGTVAASQELQEAVQALRTAGKPIVVSMGDVAASGGYYVASAADRIIANPGTITGSIGVIMNLFNLKSIEQKIGIEPEVIKSGQFKDIGSPNRAMTKEEKDLLQSIILDAYDQFVGAVATGRKMDERVVRKLADGRIFSGRQALKVGLVDELGGYEDAKAAIQKLSRQRYHLNKDLPLDETEHSGLLSMLFESTSSKLSQPGLLSEIIPESMQNNLQKLPLWLLQ